MQNSQLWDLLPTWSIYLIVVLILFLATEGGFRLGKFVQKKWPDHSESGVGTIVGAALALLGFLLAFISGIAISNFNDRRQLVIIEANAIGRA
jgi:di/tricarboxylate transporter